MKIRCIALLLVLLLFYSWQLPVTCQALETERMVLQTEKNRSDVRRYYYDEKGNCVREEWNNGKKAYTYTFNTVGKLIQKSYLLDDHLESRTIYDSRGDAVSSWQADKNGVLKQVSKISHQYDSYGRQTFYLEEDLVYGYMISNRYEYWDAPQSMIFGHYEQDGNLENGPEPIEWMILDTDGEYSLVVSKYGLDSQYYDTISNLSAWQQSDLRIWLNVYFLTLGLGDEVYKDIRPVKLEDSRGEECIFLLSSAQVQQYFPEDWERKCTATAYAVRNGAMTDQKNQGSWWFLRTPGSKNDRVMRVKADGSIDEAGIHVSSAGGTVRPALWIRNSPGRYASQQPNRITYNQYYTDETTGERKYSISIMETYDNSGRLTYSQDHVYQEFLQRTYDDYGFVTEERYWEDRGEYGIMQIETWENTYDNKGQLTKSRVRFTETLTNKQDKTEEKGTYFRTITYRYDADGHMIQREEKQDDGRKEAWSWIYDKEGRLLQTVAEDGNRTTTEVWTYLEDGGKHYQKNTLSKGQIKTESCEYDSYGNLLRKYDNGILVRENTYVPLSKALWEE